MYDPSRWNYWKREVLTYDSGVLAELDGTFVAPQCFSVTQDADSRWYVWLEDIQVDETLWTMARHGLTARHLGQFNGIYFAQRRLPDAQPWFYRGRAHESLDIAAMHFDAFERYATSFGARSWLSSLSVSRVKRLLTRRPLSIPLAWFPRLQHASPNERNNWRLLGNGYTVEWPDLDEHMRFEGLFAGRRSGGSPQSFQYWLSQRS